MGGPFTTRKWHCCECEWYGSCRQSLLVLGRYFPLVGEIRNCIYLPYNHRCYPAAIKMQYKVFGIAIVSKCILNTFWLFLGGVPVDTRYVKNLFSVSKTSTCFYVFPKLAHWLTSIVLITRTALTVNVSNSRFLKVLQVVFKAVFVFKT